MALSCFCVNSPECVEFDHNISELGMQCFALGNVDENITLDITTQLGMMLTAEYVVEDIISNSQASTLGIQVGWRVIGFDGEVLSAEHHGHTALQKLLAERKRAGKAKCEFIFDKSPRGSASSEKR